LARTALDLHLIESVILIPAAVPPHKAAPAEAAPAIRLLMAELLAEEDPRLSVDGLELSRPGPSFSIDTIRQLTDAQPENRYRLIIGSDMARTFASWRDFRELLRLAPPLVAERPTTPLSGTAETLYPGMTTAEADSLAAGRFSMHPIDTSSTRVRQLLLKRAPENELLRHLTRPVLDFIRKKGLYADYTVCG
jgi:nicotinate-nucleotide adenylyltransferase